MAHSPDDLLSVSEAAKLLCVTVETVRVWDRKGSLPSVRTPGNQRRFRRSDVEALFAPTGESDRRHGDRRLTPTEPTEASA